jgi:hypothetical protein
MNSTNDAERHGFPGGQRHEFTNPAPGRSVLACLARSCGLEPALVQTSGDELCLRLDERWGPLLESFSRLGPLGVLSPHGAARVIQTVKGVDFQPVPESTEWVDLEGALTLDTAAISFALAVEERRPQGSLIGIQFFDRAQEGLLKLLAIPGSNFTEFGNLLSRHAVQPVDLPFQAEPVAAPQPAPDLETLSADWDLYNPFLLDEVADLPVLPGEFFPQMGPARAERATERFVAAYLLNAHVTASALEVVAFSPGLVHRQVLTPNQLEPCCHGTHLVDEGGQVLIPYADLLPWRCAYGTSPTETLEFLDATGHRRLALRHTV